MEIKDNHKVIYILSHGHSGSTLLDRILGTNPELFSCGELKWFHYQVYRDGSMDPHHQDICTCKEPFSKCTFWSKVLQEISRIHELELTEIPTKFKTNIIDKWKWNNNGIWEEANIKILLHLNSFVIREFYNRLWNKNISNAWELYDLIRNISSSKLVVDSSKDLKRLVLLEHARYNQMYVILLVRDLRGVLSSYKKRNASFDAKETARIWYKSYRRYLKTIKIQFPNPAYKIVSYETLTADLKSQINTLESWVGVPQTGGKYLNTSVQHLVGGNPSRFIDEVKVKTDESWKDVLTGYELNIAEEYIEKFKKLDPVYEALY